MASDRSSLKVYRAKRSVMWAGFIGLAIIFALTVSVLMSGSPVDQGRLTGLELFWLVGICLTVLPMGFALEVGIDYVATTFLELRIRKVSASDIQSLKYGNLFGFGGLGAGKGLRIWEKTAKGRRYTTIGESIYGKEAIEHARRVLEQNVS